MTDYRTASDCIQAVADMLSPELAPVWDSWAGCYWVECPDGEPWGPHTTDDIEATLGRGWTVTMDHAYGCGREDDMCACPIVIKSRSRA